MQVRKCLYSGVEQALTFLEGNPSGWCLVGGFDPSLPFISAEDGEAAFRMRNGKRNVVSKPSCPYTGNPVYFNYSRGLWWPSGNFFNPYGKWRSKEELIYASEMRDGKNPDREAPEPSVLQAVTEREPPPPVDTDEVEVDEDKVEELLTTPKRRKPK